MVGIEWHVSVNQGHPTFLWQSSTLLIVGCWFAGHTWKNKNCCASLAGLCPRVGDPCRKRNCMLNQSLGTLQLSCNSCCCVIPYKCGMVRHVKVKNLHLLQSLRHYEHNSKFWWNLFSALCHIVCSYYVYKDCPWIEVTTYNGESYCVVVCLLEQCLCGPSLT
jgi:hypothetical protein